MSVVAPTAAVATEVAKGRERAPSEAWLGLVPPSSSAAALAWARRARALGSWTFVTLSAYYGPTGEHFHVLASLRKLGARPEDLELYAVRAGQLVALLPEHPTVVGAGSTAEWVSIAVPLCTRVTLELTLLRAVWDAIRAARRAKTGGGT